MVPKSGFEIKKVKTKKQTAEEKIAQYRLMLEKASPEMRFLYRQNTGVDLDLRLLKLTTSTRAMYFLNRAFIALLVLSALIIGSVAAYSFVHNMTDHLAVDMMQAGFIPITGLLIMIFTMIKHINIISAAEVNLDNFGIVLAKLTPPDCKLSEYSDVLTPSRVRENMVQTALKVLEFDALLAWMRRPNGATQKQIDDVGVEKELAREKTVSGVGCFRLFGLTSAEYFIHRIYADASERLARSFKDDDKGEKPEKNKRLMDPVSGFVA